MMTRHPNGYYEMFITDKNEHLATIRLCAHGNLGFTADVHVNTIDGIEQHTPGFLLSFDPTLGMWLIAREDEYPIEHLFSGSYDHALNWLDHRARLIANNARIIAQLNDTKGL